MKACPGPPELDGGSLGFITPVGQVKVVLCEGHENSESILVGLVAPDMPFEGVVDRNEFSSVCGCARKTEVLVRRSRTDVPGFACPDESPLLVLAAVVGIANDRFIVLA